MVLKYQMLGETFMLNVWYDICIRRCIFSFEIFVIACKNYISGCTRKAIFILNLAMGDLTKSERHRLNYLPNCHQGGSSCVRCSDLDCVNQESLSTNFIDIRKIHILELFLFIRLYHIFRIESISDKFKILLQSGL